MQITWKMVLFCFLLGVIGVVVGALGGSFLSNYLPLDFRFGDNVGYEATGFIGAILGLVLSGIFSMLLTNKQLKNRIAWKSSLVVGVVMVIGALLLSLAYDTFDKSLHLPEVLSLVGLLFAWIGTPVAIAKFGKPC